ncbi:MAG: hypothetical protein ACI82A_002714 [Candidatus Azotimanducaceae bacterium]|jgi:hypothetical protein
MSYQNTMSQINERRQQMMTLRECQMGPLAQVMISIVSIIFST